MSDADVIALNQLAYRYAAAVDAGDVDAFLAVFHPDGRLRSFGFDVPWTDENRKKYATGEIIDVAVS